MTPRFLPVADQALMVEFSAFLDDAAHAAVLALDHALAAQPFAGFHEAVPAFVTLLVTFDPLIATPAGVEAHLRTLLAARDAPKAKPATHEIPVTYDGPDLAEVARLTGLTLPEVAQTHQAGDYRVAMYGFAPGYAYLSGVPKALALDRKPAPVRNVPAGTVIIAGGMCLITTLTMPTGWWRIGRTSTPVLTGNPDRPFRFDVGDRIRFGAAL
jgi:inhibitor of KinA